MPQISITTGRLQLFRPIPKPQFEVNSLDSLVASVAENVASGDFLVFLSVDFLGQRQEGSFKMTSRKQQSIDFGRNCFDFSVQDYARGTLGEGTACLEVSLVRKGLVANETIACGILKVGLYNRRPKESGNGRSDEEQKVQLMCRQRTDGGETPSGSLHEDEKEADDTLKRAKSMDELLGELTVYVSVDNADISFSKRLELELAHVVHEHMTLKSEVAEQRKHSNPSTLACNYAKELTAFITGPFGTLQMFLINPATQVCSGSNPHLTALFALCLLYVGIHGALVLLTLLSFFGSRQYSGNQEACEENVRAFLSLIRGLQGGMDLVQYVAVRNTEHRAAYMCLTLVIVFCATYNFRVFLTLLVCGCALSQSFLLIAFKRVVGK